MDFNSIIEGFTAQFGSNLPKVIGALAVLIIGWFIAGIFRRLTARLLKRTNLDNRIFKGSSAGFSSEKFVSKLVYYIILMMVLMVVLEMLGVTNVLDPLKDMVNKFLAFVPNLIAAGIIAFAGYIIATLGSEVLGFASDRIQAVGERVGVSADVNLAKIVKQIVFVIIFVPLLITALDTLQLKAISDPAKEMLSSMINAIPNILVAILIVGLFYYLGTYIRGIISSVLKNLGADEFPAKLGLGNMIGANQSVSHIIASVVFFFLMFTGIVTAMEKLEFARMSTMLNELLEVTGQIFFGLVVMAVGGFVANIAHKALSSSQDNPFLASLARILVLGLFLAIALRTMGIANDIVNLAFGLTLGAVAVAVALSFGLGGREAAGKQMEHILSKFRNEGGTSGRTYSTGTKLQDKDSEK